MSLLRYNDLVFGNGGDFMIDETGDLADLASSSSSDDALRQLMIHRILAERNAWKLHPKLSAGLEDFVGRVPEPDILDQIKGRVEKALTFDSQIRRDELTVRVLDLGFGQVAVVLYHTLNESGTARPILTVSYDLQRGSITQVY